MDLLQKIFLLLGHEKNVIYSKLVESPFNVAVHSIEDGSSSDPAKWFHQCIRHGEYCIHTIQIRIQEIKLYAFIQFYIGL